MNIYKDIFTPSAEVSDSKTSYEYTEEDKEKLHTKLNHEFDIFNPLNEEVYSSDSFYAPLSQSFISMVNIANNMINKLVYVDDIYIDINTKLRKSLSNNTKIILSILTKKDINKLHNLYIMIGTRGIQMFIEEATKENHPSTEIHLNNPELFDYAEINSHIVVDCFMKEYIQKKGNIYLDGLIEGYHNTRIPLLQYSNLRYDYHKLVNHILGEDYYTTACDIYGSDDEICRDIKYRFDNLKAKYYVALISTGILSIICLIILIISFFNK